MKRGKLLKSLVMIRINETFPCVACCGQKLQFFCSEIEAKINTSSVKGSGEDENGKILFKSDIYDLF